MKKTIFLDIDGCLIMHYGTLSDQITNEVKILPGVIEKLNEWERDGHKIILTTGRKESTRKITEEQLSSVGIFYDQLIMGLNRGERIVINDSKPNMDIVTASSIQIERNRGIGAIQLKN